MKRSAQLAHIRQLSCLGISGQALMPALLRAVREYVGADSAGFFWVDAKGEMTNLYADRMLAPGLMRLYFERHYDGAEHSFREAFLQRAGAINPVVSGSPSPELLRTSYYNEILRHLDAHHVMYAVIRDQGHALGQLSLYRPKHAAAFSFIERAALKDLSRYVTHAVSRPLMDDPAAGEYVESDDECLVLINVAGKIAQGTPKALNLLSMATHSQFNRVTPPLMQGDAAPPAVARLVAALIKLLDGSDAPPPRELAETAWGRFQLSAYALGENPAARNFLVAVQIRRKERLEIKLAEALGALELPTQQREVALLLAQGKTNVEISRLLNLSPNTTGYHIKQLFNRLDAHDRAEAVARIMERAKTASAQP